MAPDAPPLFTRQFLVMCGFSFTVFLSAFQLFPVAPFRIRDLGGSTFEAGLFLGGLTYASAFSAPFTGALADRFGRRRQLLFCSVAILLLSVLYALAQSIGILITLVVVHGTFWSGLLSANAAYTVELIPPERRAEGIGYHGMASVLAVSVAPTIGLLLYEGGWIALCASVGLLNVVMALIARSIPSDRLAATVHRHHATEDEDHHTGGPAIEWRVTAAGLTVFLAALGYGGTTSFVALRADQAGLRPRALYFAVAAFMIVVSRPFAGRLADRVGTGRVLVPCLLLSAAGYAVLALPPSMGSYVVSAGLVGLGFGSVYPVFAAWVLKGVSTRRRGAAFGGMLAALDTGIGTGSIGIGWIATVASFELAFAIAAIAALFSAPYFVLFGSRLLARGAAAGDTPRRAA
jgi:MFS family permease